MPNDICGNRSWNDSESRWQCRLDGFACAGRPEPWGALCPATRHTDTPCPVCLSPDSAATTRLLRFEGPGLDAPPGQRGLFCPACGHRGSARDCAAELVRRLPEMYRRH